MIEIGSSLFGRYLVVVEVAATLLLAALVGAAVIVGHARGPLVGPRFTSIAQTSGDAGAGDTLASWPGSKQATPDRPTGGTTDGG